jgi:hypothetical protein
VLPVTAVPSGPRDDREQEREALGTALEALTAFHHEYLPRVLVGDLGHVVDALMSVVDQIAEARAVARAQAELRAAAGAYWRDASLTRYPEVRDWLRARADALGTDR